MEPVIYLVNMQHRDRAYNELFMRDDPFKTLYPSNLMLEKKITQECSSP